MPRTKKDPRIITTTTDVLEIESIPAVAKAAIVKARAAALTVTQEVIDQAKDITITTAEDYHAADEILHKIKVAQKRSGDILEEVIRPVRDGLEQVYAVRRLIENPLLDLERVVKEKMRVWQIADRARIDKENYERRKIEEEQRRLEALKVVELANKGDFTGAAAVLTQPETVVLHPTPPPQPIRAASSSARPVKKWRLTDLELLVQAVYLEMVPIDVLMVNPVKVGEIFKADPAV